MALAYKENLLGSSHPVLRLAIANDSIAIDSNHSYRWPHGVLIELPVVVLEGAGIPKHLVKESPYSL